MKRAWRDATKGNEYRFASSMRGYLDVLMQKSSIQNMIINIKVINTNETSMAGKNTKGYV